MDGFEDNLSGDLADLPQHFQEVLGPTGEAVMERAHEEGFGFSAAQIAGDAAHAAAWDKSEDEFRSEVLSLSQPAEILFEAVRDLLAHEALWPWSSEMDST